jgi:gluconate 5-dehydrogenase
MNTTNNNLFSLQGEVAIVTGGTGHIGYAIAEGLSQFGANVVIAGRDEDKCCNVAQKISSKTGNKCIGVKLDISSRESVKYGFKKAALNMGGINILINNSSYSAQNSLGKMTDEEWQIGLDGTITGVMICTQEVLHYLQKSQCQNRAIVNIASMYGIVSPDPRIYGDTGFDNPPNYGVGKAAIIHLTKYAACHLAQYGVRVNCISPGPFPDLEVQENKWFIKRLKEKTPLNRIGHPQEIKGAVVFLSSNASSYVTGHNLVVDGGWTIW